MWEPRRTGFVDESYGRDVNGRLVYVLGLVEVDSRDADEVRAILTELPRKRGGVLHFANDDATRRTTLAKAIGGLPIRRSAIVSRGGDSGSRARAVGLTTVAWAKGTELDLLIIESRGTRPDRSDAALLSRVHPPACFPVAFLSKQDDPLLWAADIVASATFQALARGVQHHLDAMGHVEQFDC
jgi:hypothetical protein